MQKSEKDSTSSSSNSPTQEDHIKEVAKTLKLQVEKDILSMASMQQFFMAYCQAAAPEYTKYLEINRTERRKLNVDSKEYVKLVADFAAKREEIIKDTQKALLKAVGLSPSLFDESIEKYYKDDDQRIFMLMPQQWPFLKSCVPAKKTLSLQDLTKAKEAEIEALSNIEKIRGLFNMFKPSDITQAGVQLLVETVGMDAVYEKCQVEEEDIISAIENFQNEQVVKDLYRKAELCMMKLM